MPPSHCKGLLKPVLVQLDSDALQAGRDSASAQELALFLQLTEMAFE